MTPMLAALALAAQAPDALQLRLDLDAYAVSSDTLRATTATPAASAEAGRAAGSAEISRTLRPDDRGAPMAVQAIAVSPSGGGVAQAISSVSVNASLTFGR